MGSVIRTYGLRPASNEPLPGWPPRPMSCSSIPITRPTRGRRAGPTTTLKKLQSGQTVRKGRIPNEMQGAELDTKGWIPDDRELDRGANSVVYLARREGTSAVLKV